MNLFFFSEIFFISVIPHTSNNFSNHVSIGCFKTSAPQTPGNVSELIHISQFCNLVFSIPDLIVHPLMEQPDCLYPAMQKLFFLILSKLSFHLSLSHLYCPHHQRYTRKVNFKFQHFPFFISIISNIEHQLILFKIVFYMGNSIIMKF